MKNAFAEQMLIGNPAPWQVEARETVLEIARSWTAGGVDLAGVRRVSTGYDRNIAIRCVGLGSPEKLLLMALGDALCADQHDGFESKHGHVARDEMHLGEVKAMTNHEGRRVYVWPLHGIHGEKVYPRVDLPPGEERRRLEAAMNLTYLDYRRKKRGGA